MRATYAGVGIAGHERLDQLATDEGADVRMLVDRVERVGEVLRRGLAGRQHLAVQDRLRRDVVMRVERHQIGRIVDGVRPLRRGGPERRVGPAGERAREGLDDGEVVARHRHAARIVDRRAVGVELRQPDREQLQHLARVVLVRLHGRRRLVVVDHVEVVAHRRMERHALDQLAIVDERVVEQHLLVVANAVRRLDVDRRDHEDLRVRERDPLPQLVRAGQRVAIELRLHRERRVVVANAGRRRGARTADRTVRVDVRDRRIAGRRRRELSVDPGRDALRLHRRDRRRRRSERRLVEQPRDVARGRRRHRRGRRRRRRRARGDRRRGARVAPTAATASGEQGGDERGAGGRRAQTGRMLGDDEDRGRHGGACGRRGRTVGRLRVRSGSSTVAAPRASVNDSYGRLHRSSRVGHRAKSRAAARPRARRHGRFASMRRPLRPASP